MKKLCLVCSYLGEEAISTLSSIMSKDYEVVVRYEENYKENPFTDEELHDASVIFGNPSIHTLTKCENLKWLQLASAESDDFTQSGLINPFTTTLTNSKGAYGHAISEYLIAAVFSMIKKLHLYRDNQFDGLWDDLGTVKTILGSKVLIVGLGDTGNNFAIKMNALGANVYVIKSDKSEFLDYSENVYTLEKIQDILPEMDIVALCPTNSNSTQNLINRENLDLMKKDSILINVGFGNTVNTEDLYDALVNEKIGGAILDVTNPEPLPSYNPLWKLKNVIITPHISGGFHSKETIENIENLFIENATRYTKGLELINQVDFNESYKK